MIRPLIALLVLAGIALAAMFFADRPGSVTINWAGYRIQASMVALALAGLFVALAVWLLARLWSWIRGGTPLSPERRALRRKQKGLNEVDAALSALAAGDGRKALSLGQQAITHLEGAGVAYLVSAQAATACGKDDLAERYFDALSQTKHGKFLGLRGRVSEARRLGHVSKALDLAEEAVSAAPRSDWALVTAFELETKLGKWADAQATLKKAIAQSIFDKAVGAQHLGAIRYGEALAAQQDGRMADAMRHTKQALSVRPNFVPAAVLGAQLYKAAGKLRAASKLIEKVWALEPHHSLAECYAALKPMETPAARMARFETLFKLAPDHSESQIRFAEAAFNAGEYSRAESVLAPHLAGLPRARAGRLMGQIAAAKGDPAADREKWSDLASQGAPDPVYECSHCRAQWSYWTSHCAACDSFNSLVWDRATQTPIDPAADALSPVGIAPPQAQSGETGAPKEEAMAGNARSAPETERQDEAALKPK